MPIVAAPPRDPRSIVTPDAFEVSPALLGLPLASPMRRLGAMLIDLGVIGVVTLLTKSFALVLGVVVAVLFVRQGFKRTEVPGSVFNRAMRLSVGCLGIFIGIITAVIWAAVGIGGNLGSRSGDFSEDRIREMVAAAAPGAEVLVADTAAGATAEDAGAADTLTVDTLTADTFAADTLLALISRVTQLDASRDESARAADSLRRELQDERRRKQEGGGVFSVLRDFVDELGFGFGWASLYLTVVLSWWKGQTVGKRLMKIRVLRLDGAPITWWTAFERAGGYAAGFATGLLGFAQVYWDANRQAIHDRIVGTVVVVDGARPVVDWQKTL